MPPARKPDERPAAGRREDADQAATEAPAPRVATPVTARAYFTVGQTTASWTGAPPAHGEEREPDIYLTDLEPVGDPDTAAGDALVFPSALRVRRATAGGPFTEGRRVAVVLSLEVE